MIHVRASMLNHLKDCPGYYYLKDKCSSEDNQSCSQGRLAHKWIANKISGLKITQEEEDQINADLKINLHRFMNQWEWSEYFWKLEVAPHQGAEVEYEIVTEDYRLTGSPDLWLVDDENNLFIFDWKTGGRLLPPIHKDLQMKAYAELMMNNLGGLKINPVITVVRVVISDEIQFEEIEFEQESLRYPWVDEIVDLINSQPQCKTGLHCSHCFACEICEDYQKPAHQLVPYAPTVSLTTSEDVARVHAALGPAEALLESAKKAVKDWYRNNGPVVQDGVKYGLTAYSMDKIDDIERVEQLVPESIEIKKSTSKARIKRALEDQKLSKKDIEEFMDELKQKAVFKTIQCERLSITKVK